MRLAEIRLAFCKRRLKKIYAAGCAYLSVRAHLTPIEYKLLCLLSKNVGKVSLTLSTPKLWGARWKVM